MFLYSIWQNQKFRLNDCHPKRQENSVIFAYTFYTRIKFCHMACSALEYCYLPLPGFTCPYLFLSAHTLAYST